MNPSNLFAFRKLAPATSAYTPNSKKLNQTIVERQDGFVGAGYGFAAVQTQSQGSYQIPYNYLESNYPNITYLETDPSAVSYGYYSIRTEPLPYQNPTQDVEGQNGLRNNLPSRCPSVRCELRYFGNANPNVDCRLDSVHALRAKRVVLFHSNPLLTVAITMPPIEAWTVKSDYALQTTVWFGLTLPSPSLLPSQCHRPSLTVRCTRRALCLESNRTTHLVCKGWTDSTRRSSFGLA